MAFANSLKNSAARAPSTTQVIARKRHGHHRPDTGFSFNGHDAIGNAAYRQNRRLRRRDDRAEGIDLVHAKIAQRKCSTANICRPQPPRRARSVNSRRSADFRNLRRFRFVNHRAETTPSFTPSPR